MLSDTFGIASTVSPIVFDQHEKIATTERNTSRQFLLRLGSPSITGRTWTASGGSNVNITSTVAPSLNSLLSSTSPPLIPLVGICVIAVMMIAVTFSILPHFRRAAERTKYYMRTAGELYKSSSSESIVLRSATYEYFYNQMSMRCTGDETFKRMSVTSSSNRHSDTDMPLLITPGSRRTNSPEHSSDTPPSNAESAFTEFPSTQQLRPVSLLTDSSMEASRNRLDSFHSVHHSRPVDDIDLNNLQMPPIDVESQRGALLSAHLALTESTSSTNLSNSNNQLNSNKRTSANQYHSPQPPSTPHQYSGVHATPMGVLAGDTRMNRPVNNYGRRSSIARPIRPVGRSRPNKESSDQPISVRRMGFFAK